MTLDEQLQALTQTLGILVNRIPPNVEIELAELQAKVQTIELLAKNNEKWRNIAIASVVANLIIFIFISTFLILAIIK